MYYDSRYVGRIIHKIARRACTRRTTNWVILKNVTPHSHTHRHSVGTTFWHWTHAALPQLTPCWTPLPPDTPRLTQWADSESDFSMGHLSSGICHPRPHTLKWLRHTYRNSRLQLRRRSKLEATKRCRDREGNWRRSSSRLELLANHVRTLGRDKRRRMNIWKRYSTLLEDLVTMFILASLPESFQTMVTVLTYLH